MSTHGLLSLIYCCVVHHPKAPHLLVMLSCCLVGVSQEHGYRFSASGSLSSPQSRCPPGLRSQQKTELGRALFPSSSTCLLSGCLLKDGWAEGTTGYWLQTGLGYLSHGFSLLNIKSSRRESVRKTQVIISCNLITDVQCTSS